MEEEEKRSKRKKPRYIINSFIKLEMEGELGLNHKRE